MTVAGFSRWSRTRCRSGRPGTTAAAGRSRTPAGAGVDQAPRPSFFGPISAPLEFHRKLPGRLPVGGVVVSPVQVVPLSAKLAGAGLLRPRAVEAERHAGVAPDTRVVAGVRGPYLAAALGDAGVPVLADLLAGGVGPGERPAVDRATEVGDDDVRVEAVRPLRGHLVGDSAAGGGRSAGRVTAAAVATRPVVAASVVALTF